MLGEHAACHQCVRLSLCKLQDWIAVCKQSFSCAASVDAAEILLQLTNGIALPIEMQCHSQQRHACRAIAI